MTFSLTSCASGAQSVKAPIFKLTLKTLLSHSVNEIGAQNVQLSENAFLLDTREQSEFDVSNIKGAIHVGYDHFDMKSVQDIPKDAKVLLYCSVGYRSEKIGERMIKEGWTEISNLYGGIFEWKNIGNSVVDSTGIETERVHAFDQIWGRFLHNGEKVY